MRKTSKAWLIVGLLLILVGGLLFVGELALHRWDLGAFGTTKLETGTAEIAESFRSISITSDTEDIRLLPGSDGACRVDYAIPEHRKLSASVQGGTLSIEVTDQRKWSDNIPFSFGVNEKARITVYLPERDYEVLSIEEDTGDIVLPGDFSFESIRISTDTGDVDCRASSSGLLSIDTDTGDTRLEGLSAGTLSLSTDTGRIELRSVSCAEDLGVTVQTGKTVLNDVTCGSFTSRGDTGDLRLEQVLVDGLLSAERSTGDVRLEDCDAEELLISTDTGDVSGTLLTEKVFLVRSSTGKIRVPETVSGGKCKITTVTGDISIEIG